MLEKTITTNSVEATRQLGVKIGKNLRGGEVIELTSDLGGGKTTLTAGLVEGFGSTDPVASPSFTIGNVYKRRDKKEFHHFDFYRLSDAGIVKNELVEVIGDPEVVVAVEWGEVVHDVLPGNRVSVSIAAIGEQKRSIVIRYPKEFSYVIKIAEGLEL